MWRFLRLSLCCVSLLLCVALGVMWVRSYDEWDQVNGYAGHDFRFSSFSGGFELYLSRAYVLREGLTVQDIDPLDPAAFSVLTPEHFDRPFSVVVRGRYPLNDTSKLLTAFETFAGFGYNSSLAQGDGPKGPYTWCKYIRMPYWSFVLTFALLPTLALARHIRRSRTNPTLCPTCSYDLSATPDRCPECGTVAKLSKIAS